MPTRDELVTQLQAEMNAIGIRIADARMAAVRASKIEDQKRAEYDAAAEDHVRAKAACESFERDQYAEVERLSVQIVALRAVSDPKPKHPEGYVPEDTVAAVKAAPDYGALTDAGKRAVARGWKPTLGETIIPEEFRDPEVSNPEAKEPR